MLTLPQTGQKSKSVTRVTHLPPPLINGYHRSGDYERIHGFPCTCTFGFPSATRDRYESYRLESASYLEPWGHARYLYGPYCRDIIPHRRNRSAQRVNESAAA